MNNDELKKLWEDPKNWTMWSYNCADDPRVIVPKRNPAMGWTINAAHKKALPVFILTLIVTLALPAVVVITEGNPFNEDHFLLAVLASGALLIAVCIYFAGQHKR
jgi:hypothetical protein